MTRRNKQTEVPTVRCAIYTRKSTEEGLEQEFNSLDAQRESGEAFIASQRHEGWQCVPEHYDDGGFTGGNTDRPALRRLLADIQAGKIDCVVVYKVDRLSRSLLDFAKLMDVFDTTGTSFCSVTQQFNTATSMGRLVLNILLSFAQFEREMISERVRDKIAASRRKGKWSGGMPILGYTVKDTKLVVHQVEAERVRQIFQLYLDYQSLLATVTELNRRGWTTKRWTTKKGTQRGGKLFTKNSLYALLTNVTYIGKIKYKDEVHNGEHEAIVPDELFGKAQTLLPLFLQSADSPTSVILTGTAGDGKTHLCRQVWIQLGGDPDDWESDEVYFHINANIGGKDTTVHIVRDLTGLPETGKTGDFLTKTDLLEFFSYTIFDDSSSSVFLIAANDGQLVDTWASLSREKDRVDDTGRLLEELLFNGRREEEGSRLKLFNLSRNSSAELFDCAVDAFVNHPGWKHCLDEAEADDELFGKHCPIRQNYELLKSNQVRSRLRSLLELCDHNDSHLSIRRVLMLLANSVLGFAGNDAGGIKVPDRLLRAVDIPRVIESHQVAKASIYNNIFGGNLTEHRRNSHDIYEQLGRFRIGHETSNRIDNLLIYGDSDIGLKTHFDLFLTNDEFYGATESYRALQMAYIEAAEEGGDETEQFLEMLVSQRRGLFFKIPESLEDELSPWALTVFSYAGEYLDRVLRRLREEKKIEKRVVARLTQGLNRIFIGMLVASDDELWLTTGLSGANAKVSFVLEDRVSVARDSWRCVTIVADPAGFPMLSVSFDENSVVQLKLTLTRFEFLSRVAEGVLPGSFSKECHEDILAFKSRLLIAAKQRKDGSTDDEDSHTEFRFVELDEMGYPRPKTVELDV